MLAKRAITMIAGFAVSILLLIFFVSPATQAAPQIDNVPVQDWFKMGVEKTKQGNYQLALLNFNEAIKLGTNLAASYSNRCLVNIHLKNYLPAKYDCTQALQHQPANHSVYLNRGLASYRLGNYQAAIADYNAALQLKPDSVPAYYNRGLAYADRENYLEAIADYNRALSQMSQPDSLQLATIYSDRALAYFSLGNLEGAIVDLNQSIRLDSTSSLTYYNRACVYQKQGRYQKAIQDFTQSLQRDPNLAEAYINRGLIRHQLGDRQAALKDLRLGAKCFCQQEKLIAYQKILKLIEEIQQSFSSSESVIA
jgi:tetratricopeptide (TPR) repeat protein